MHGFGSSQTALSALGFRRSDAFVMRAVRNRMYMEMVAREARLVHAVCCDWDGGCHGGLETLLGSVRPCYPGGRSWYFRPQDPVCIKRKNQRDSTVGGRAMHERVVLDFSRRT